jgi:hypothetical protein
VRFDTVFFMTLGNRWFTLTLSVSRAWRSLFLTREQKRLQTIAGIRNKQ